MRCSHRNQSFKVVVTHAVPAVPPPLEPLGLGSVRDHLNPEAPNFKQEDFTAQQWENISKIEQTLTGAISKGKLKAGSIVVAAADRADGKVFKQINSLKTQLRAKYSH